MINPPEDFNFASYKRLLTSVVIQAMKDYYHGQTLETKNKKGELIEVYPSEDAQLEKKKVVEWVKEMSGTFELCALALNMDPLVLQEIMLTKMKAIDKGEKLKFIKIKV